jgi:16S rRNA (cytosine967-C5)-methyltransferase
VSKSTAIKSIKSKKITPRISAAIIFSQLLKQQGSLASLLPQHTEHFSPQEKSLIKELCYGCCRYHPVLADILRQLLTQPLKKKEADIEAVLLLGLYQLQFMRIAEHAAINESVNAAAYFKKPWAKKLINAILRAFQRDQAALYAGAEERQPSMHPAWLENKIRKAWPQQAEQIFTANNQHAPLVLRVNAQKMSRSDYLQVLVDASIDAHPASFSEVGIYLTAAIPVTALPLFAEGVVSVQDEAAQLAASLLQLQPGLRVLDACSAPGGKTCHIGESAPALQQLMALDLESRRLKKVHDNLQRLNIRADVVCADAGKPAQWWDGQLFDRILLDAPCSATGIIRRQADVKLLRQPDHIALLVTTQLRLLQALWPLLAQGGILLYATCSILPEENSQLIAQFLQMCTDAQHDPVTFADDEPVWGVEQVYGRQLFPQASGHDGFFYARLKKA